MLLGALTRCASGGSVYRCFGIADALVELYRNLNQPVMALKHAEAAWALARGAGEWGFELVFLQGVAEVAHLGLKDHLARAFLDEAELRNQEAPSCSLARTIPVWRAKIHLEDLQPDQARRALDLSPACGGQPGTLMEADVIAGLAHWGARAGDAQRLEQVVASVMRRARPALAVTAEQVAGRFWIEQHRDEGVKRLERAIANAASLPNDPTVQRNVAVAYSALVMDAGRRRDFGRAFSLIARETLASTPGNNDDGVSRRCAVALAVDLDQALVAARTESGATIGLFEEHKGGPDPGRLLGNEVRSALGGCPRVDVYAGPPLQGAGLGLDGLPWAYRISGRAQSAVSSSLPHMRLLISPVNTPPDLSAELPSLPRWTSHQRMGPLDEELTGRAARPADVLRKMRQATEIDFISHGLVDLGAADASFLVLAADPRDDGRYRLTARDIRIRHLEEHPLVILASCHATAVSRSWRRPWSLPAAFLEAGAAAVVTCPSGLEHDEVERFIDNFRSRLLPGVDYASALEQTRKASLATNGLSGVRDIVLFQ